MLCVLVRRRGAGGLGRLRRAGGRADGQRLLAASHYRHGAAAPSFAATQRTDVARPERNLLVLFAGAFGLTIAHEHQQLCLLRIREHIGVALVRQAGLADEIAQVIRRQLQRLGKLLNRYVNHRCLRPPRLRTTALRAVMMSAAARSSPTFSLISSKSVTDSSARSSMVTTPPAASAKASV